MRAGLEQISSFLSSHAREVVFLDFNHFYGVQNLHHEKLVAMLKEVFGDKLCPVVFAQEVLSNSNTLNAEQEVGIAAIKWPRGWPQSSFSDAYFTFKNSCLRKDTLTHFWCLEIGFLIIIVYSALYNTDFCILITLEMQNDGYHINAHCFVPFCIQVE